jgi:hypothetical protein
MRRFELQQHNAPERVTGPNTIVDASFRRLKWLAKPILPTRRYRGDTFQRRQMTGSSIGVTPTVYN